MPRFKYVALTALAGLSFAGMSSIPVQAQVSINIGPAPNCPYGYYETAPYGCAPYGYYGPQWFNGGLFIGAGPWFHGPDHFHGYVNNHYHPDYGYRGPMPHPGDRPVEGWQNHGNFHGNEWHDGHGHAGHDDHGHGH